LALTKYHIKIGHFVPNFGEIQGFQGEKFVSLKKVFTQSRLNYDFQICPNFTRLGVECTSRLLRLLCSTSSKLY